MAESDWSLSLALGLFALAVIIVLIFGTLMTRLAAQLAERTGLGEAVMGAFFLGASTSLPEIVTTVTASLSAHADLAVSNAVGSIAGQTAFLALADITYRRANLEHAAASAENLMLAAFVTMMLTLPMLGLALPQATVLGVHPVTLLMFAAYIQGIRIVSRTHARPMWLPRHTRETRTTASESPQDTDRKLSGLWLKFALAAMMTGSAGWLLAHAAVPIAEYSGLSQTVIGGLLTGLTSSLPELITALAAVRMGALTLAVGNIFGGNAFDVLIVAFADWTFPGGSVFAALSGQQLFLLALSLLLTAILLMGMLYREKHGLANIGLESVLVLALYLGGFASLVAFG